MDEHDRRLRKIYRKHTCKTLHLKLIPGTIMYNLDLVTQNISRQNTCTQNSISLVRTILLPL